MFRHTVSVVGIAVFAFVGTKRAYAWGNFGHEEVAAAAYDQLTQAARDGVNALLMKNPQYGDWVNGVAKKSQARIAFVMAATWLEWIKKQKNYVSDGSDNGDRPPPGPEASQNVGMAT
jgi:hypothetical protein